MNLASHHSSRSSRLRICFFFCLSKPLTLKFLLQKAILRIFELLKKFCEDMTGFVSPRDKLINLEDKKRQLYKPTRNFKG